MKRREAVLSPAGNRSWKRRVSLLFSLLSLLLFVLFVVQPQRWNLLTPGEIQTLARADAAQRFEQDIAQLKERIDAEPGNPRWRRELAARYVPLQLWVDVAEVLEDAVQAGDETPFTLNGLGEAYWNLGNREEAIRWYKRNLKAHPQEALAYLTLSGAYADMGETKWAQEVLSHLPESTIKPEMLLPIALAYAKAGDGTKALTFCKRALRADPKNVDAWWLLARSSIQQNRWQEAVVALEKTTQLNPNRAEFWYLFGLCRERLSPKWEMAAAVSLWQKAVELDPTMGPAHYALAAAYERAGRLSDAARAYVRSYENPPRSTKSLDDLARVYRRMGKTSLAHKAQGLYYKHKGDAEKAIREFTARLKLETANVLAYLDLADAYQNAARPQEAANILKQALRHVKNQGAIYYRLAQIYQAQERVKEEKEALQRVIQLAPKESAFAHRELSRIAMEKEGDYDRAEEHIRKAIALTPQEPEYYVTLGIVLSLRPTKGGRLEKAVDAFQQALVLQPSHVNAAFQLGILLQKAGRLEEAAAHFRVVISRAPTFGEAYLKLQQVYQKQGKQERAVNLLRLYQEYRRATADREKLERRRRAHPNDPAAVTALAGFYLRNGEVENAEGELKRLIRLRPDSPEAHEQLAVIYGMQSRAQDEADERRTAERLRRRGAQARKYGR